jgi:class 3 adenylate cyclase/tetratricopeptide (TPR) repeat protein
VNCTACGHSNQDGMKFCVDCGTPFAQSCAVCGTTLPVGARFCGECGGEVGTTPVPTEPEDVAVRKTVTVMFADLVGSTAFGEAVDVESARREMAKFHELSRAVIERNAGALVKFIGDGVMAVFGIPEIAEDDADRAVRAGLDLQREFTGVASLIHSRYGLTVGLRVGINSGEIVIANDDADMVGDAINTAARIEAQCTPGHVLVGEQTWRLTRSAVDYEVLGEVKVKGKGQAIATFQVIAAAVDEEVATPFVGRTSELNTLSRCLNDVIENRSPRLVTVIGSPGVGKTRLAAELASGATRVSTFDLRVDRAGAATFEPIADLLRAVVDLPERLDSDDVIERLNLFSGEAADQDKLLPVLASFVGAAPLRSTEESLWAARRLVELIAAERPAIIVVDDIQWAESLFLDLLEHLVEWVDGPALIVALARPEIREIRPAFAEMSGRVSEVVALEGLDAATTEALAAGILGSDQLPLGLAARLPESTDGNPLFVRELIRMLIDDGTITDTPTGWTLSIEADAVEVPPTIMSLLASRVERMDDDERRVVEMAGVVGSEFSRGAVASLLPAIGGAQLDRILERLRRQEVIDATGNYWGDEPLWRFHHVLIRDAAYRRLLKERRADLHRRVAEWTETASDRFGGEQEIGIAFHYERAHEYLGQLGPLDTDASALGIRAAELLAVAARRALDQDDLSAAGGLAQRALDRLAPDDERRPELLLIACESFFSAARVRDGEPMLDELRSLGEHDPRVAAWATAFDGQRTVLTEPERLADAEPLVALAVATLIELGDDVGVAKSRLVRALVLASQGRVGDAEIELDEALTSARAANDRRRVTAVLAAAPLAALWGPSPVARAGGRCLDVIRLLRITSASPMVEATSISGQAVLEAMRGRFDESRKLIVRSATIVEELGLRHGVLETAMFAGYIELLADDPIAAEQYLRTAYNGLVELGAEADAGRAAAHLARSLFAQGRIDEAAEIADASDALAGQNLRALISSRAVRAEIAAKRGDGEGARKLATEAVEIAQLTDLTIDHADAARSLGVVLRSVGDDAAAIVAERTARDLYNAKGASVASRSLEPPFAGSERGGLHNAATAMVAHFFYEAWTNRDANAALSYSTPDGRYTDHRKIAVGDLPLGKVVEFMDAGLQDVERVDWSVEVLALRGDRLSLYANWYHYQPSEFRRELVSVSQVNAAGLGTSADTYDVEDLDLAYERLNQLYLEGEGAEFAHVLGPWIAIERARSVGDSESVLALTHPDGVCTDQRPGQESEIPIQEMAGYVEGLSGSIRSTKIHHIDENGLVWSAADDLTDGAGSRLIGRTCDLFTLRDGLVHRWETFAEDAEDAALARYRQLTTSPAAPKLTNNAARNGERFWYTVYHDLDLDAAFLMLSEDLVSTDHRRMIGSPDLTKSGVRGFLELFIAGRTSEIVHTLEVLAVRGDNFALLRLDLMEGDTGWSQSLLQLHEMGADGLASRATSYSPEDVDRALRDLDETYAASLGEADDL